MQLVQGVLLLSAFAAFELEMRIVGWTERARPSPYWVDGRWNDPIDYSLVAHLPFAIPTLVLWTVVMVQALRKFPRPVGPGAHSQAHVRWARLAAVAMLMTAMTGWTFYWLAFAAGA